MVVESQVFNDAFNKVKSVGTDATDEEIKAFLIGVDLSNQPDFSIVDGVIVPRSYVDSFIQTCFENNLLLTTKLDETFINGDGKDKPIGLINGGSCNVK